MMRAEHVRGERVGDVTEGLTYVRGARAVVHHARAQFRHRARNGSAIEQIDVLTPPARDPSASRLQVFDQIAPDESTGARHENSVHVREPYCFW